MTDAQILVPLKVDLQLSTTALDDYLTQQVNAAKEYITTEGILHFTDLTIMQS